MRPKTDKVQITMKVPSDKKAKAQRIAEEKGITLTVLIILALNNIIEEEEKQKSRQ